MTDSNWYIFKNSMGLNPHSHGYSTGRIGYNHGFLNHYLSALNDKHVNTYQKSYQDYSNNYDLTYTDCSHEHKYMNKGNGNQPCCENAMFRKNLSPNNLDVFENLSSPTDSKGELESHIISSVSYENQKEKLNFTNSNNSNYFKGNNSVMFCNTLSDSNPNMTQLDSVYPLKYICESENSTSFQQSKVEFNEVEDGTPYLSMCNNYFMNQPQNHSSLYQSPEKYSDNFHMLKSYLPENSQTAHLFDIPRVSTPHCEDSIYHFNNTSELIDHWEFMESQRTNKVIGSQNTKNKFSKNASSTEVVSTSEMKFANFDKIIEKSYDEAELMSTEKHRIFLNECDSCSDTWPTNLSQGHTSKLNINTNENCAFSTYSSFPNENENDCHPISEWNKSQFVNESILRFTDTSVKDAEIISDFNNSSSAEYEITRFNSISSSQNSDLTLASAINLSSGAYFWQYNSQCKGPKASPLLNLSNIICKPGFSHSYEQEVQQQRHSPSLTENYNSDVYQDNFISSSASVSTSSCFLSSQQSNNFLNCPISPSSLPDYPLVLFEDPVQRRYDLVHCSKLRRGDGNDVTPNLMRLQSMGHELAYLNRHIMVQGELIATGSTNITADYDLNENVKTTINNIPVNDSNYKLIENAKKEKNKLASKICRLKKKAFHEANKIKYLGLEIEYNELAVVITKLKQLVTQWFYTHSANLAIRSNEHQTTSDEVTSSVNWPQVQSSSSETLITRNCNSSKSLHQQAIDIYENYHITKIAGRMDSVVDEVIHYSSNNVKDQNHPLLRALINPKLFQNQEDIQSSSSSIIPDNSVNQMNSTNTNDNQWNSLKEYYCSPKITNPTFSRLNINSPPVFKIIYPNKN